METRSSGGTGLLVSAVAWPRNLVSGGEMIADRPGLVFIRVDFKWGSREVVADDGWLLRLGEGDC